MGTTSIIAKSSSNLLRIAVTPEELANKMIPVKGNGGIFFGRESKGLSLYELRRCDIIVSIPSSQVYRTLNISSASAIILYEIWKSKIGNRRGLSLEVDAISREKLRSRFDEILERISLPSHKKRLSRRAFKNIISRAFISSREASLLIGVFRRVLNNV